MTVVCLISLLRQIILMCVGTTFDYATASAKKYGLPVLIGIWVGESILVMLVLVSFADKRNQMGQLPTRLLV